MLPEELCELVNLHALRLVAKKLSWVRSGEYSNKCYEFVARKDKTDFYRWAEHHSQFTEHSQNLPTFHNFHNLYNFLQFSFIYFITQFTVLTFTCLARCCIFCFCFFFVFEAFYGFLYFTVECQVLQILSANKIFYWP